MIHENSSGMSVDITDVIFGQNGSFVISSNGNPNQILQYNHFDAYDLQSIQYHQNENLLQDDQQTTIPYNINNNNSNFADNSQLSVGNLTGCCINFDKPNETVQDDVILENDSKALNVEDSNNEHDVLPKDDAFAYLHELNSDNLMQFSQQSVIQDMVIKEHLEVKPNLDVLPTLEEHDIGGYKFQLNLDTMQKGKVNWCYSDTLNKVYIRMNDIFSFEAVYTPKFPLQELRIRALMCFGKEVSTPVLRCQNHISKDDERNSQIRHSLMRCENPTTEYCGTPEGKSINDRFSVVIPLGMCGMPKNDKSVHQTIALKFTCQNSCIGRRETSIVFLLEGMNGEILSQRVLDIKICSCPKRDRDIDKRNIMATKRKMSEVLYPGDKKSRKKDPLAISLIKQESFTSDVEENNSELCVRKEFDIEPTPSGGYRVVMEFDSITPAVESIKCVLINMAAKIFLEPEIAHRHKRNCRRLKRLQDKALKFNHHRGT